MCAVHTVSLPVISFFLSPSREIIAKKYYKKQFFTKICQKEASRPKRLILHLTQNKTFIDVYVYKFAVNY